TAAQRNYDFTQDPIIRRAQADLKSFQQDGRPRRFYVPLDQFDMALREEDRNRFDDILRAHPKTQRLLEDNRDPDATDEPLNIVPVTPPRPILWIIPPLDPLLEKLQQDTDAYNRIIYRARTPKTAVGAPHDSDLKSIREMPLDQWWTELRAALKALTK